VKKSYRVWLVLIARTKKPKRGKRSIDKPWSERDLFDLGIGVGHGAARDLGREEAIADLAKFLKRREDEIQGKLIELGFFANGQESHRRNKRESGPGKKHSRPSMRSKKPTR
jgi:hypothetical protein